LTGEALSRKIFEFERKRQAKKGDAMEEGKFREIIRFAIEKEAEASDFYMRASQFVKFSGTRDLFLDFAKQEERHRKMLEDLDLEKIAEMKIQPIPDLMISEYLVDAELRPDVPYADILRIAMKREERSIKLYRDLGEPVRNESLKKLFAFLGQEEKRHKYALEKIYDEEILK
jgi:rubrerythrin